MKFFHARIIKTPVWSGVRSRLTLICRWERWESLIGTQIYQISCAFQSYQDVCFSTATIVPVQQLRVSLKHFHFVHHRGQLAPRCSLINRK